MQKYLTSNQEEVEVIQYYGDNYWDIVKFIGKKLDTRWLTPTFPLLKIPTTKGDREAQKGYWIVKGINGGFDVYEPSIFEKRFKPIISATA